RGRRVTGTAHHSSGAMKDTKPPGVQDPQRISLPSWGSFAGPILLNRQRRPTHVVGLSSEHTGKQSHATLCKNCAHSIRTVPNVILTVLLAGSTTSALKPGSI